MCKPIIAVLNIIISDMVAKSKWCIKHMICFKPEELELDITSESQKQELDFQYVIENLTNTLPIYLQNKNSIDMPIKLSMLHVRIYYNFFKISLEQMSRIYVFNYRMAQKCLVLMVLLVN